ncbi:MAG: carboxypeptidase-like regulatory domain-containing protein [Bacteroidetes bacterium]|nr:carboxypeptidase-like regulatory domain-containing protein [Bacteroidota bacterium]MBK9301978.1 carboxypeptidase-like regulatory domain-containing protein [Bacteroidota bacterium]MBK9481545.1 carboxypeptidase-like regulatory domain-containing protein [Bacteroidota bacterium]HQW45928.1 carboxypeptidase-like regulatory domain-containing protein [Chitinophagaceae bacterium]
MKKIAVLLLFLGTTFNLMAGIGKIEGKVTDETNAPLIGATVKIEGTLLGARTDIDGHFIIKNIELGKYNLEVSYVSYEKKLITDIIIKDDNIVTVNVSMAKAPKGMKEVTIKATLKKENLSSLLVQQKNLATISDGISAESIRRTPDRNTSDVLKRVSGVSINEGKFAVVRGLPDRYNMAMLNGMVLPSTEADRKAFSFDMFPSSLLDNITILKAATPDMQGDFAGGVIDLNTKDIPTENYLTVQLGSGMNTLGTFKPYNDSKNGKKDWLGFDDGSRKLPSSFPVTDSFYSTTFTRQQKIDASKEVPNNWEIKKRNSMMPNRNVQVVGGYSHTFKNNNVFGVIGALSYNRTQRINYIERNDYELSPIPVFTYSDTVARDNVLAGALLNMGYRINSNHKITFRNTFNVNSEDATINRFGDNKINEQFIKATSAQFTSNTLMVNQLSGEHVFTKRKIKLQWTGAYNNIVRNTPDLRKTYYSINYANPDDSTYTANVPMGKASPNFAGKFYSTLNENVYNGKVDITVPFTIQNVAQSVKVGGFIQNKNRDFSARVLGYVISNISKFDSKLLDLPEEKIFDQANMSDNGFRLDDITQPTDKYTASSDLHAGYIMFDNKFLKKMRAVWGVRYEGFSQELKTKNNKETVSIQHEFKSILPSLNLTYALNKKTNIRFCASKTLSRPEFREMSRFAFYDFNSNAVIQGNDSLVQASIQNYDLRYEIYPGKGELFSFSLFYKRFDKPVEQVFISQGAGSRLRYFQNGNYANDYGAELEFRKSLSFINENEKSIWSNISLFGNVAIIKSIVKLDDVSAEATSERPLQGQSPYLINVGASFNHAATGITSTLLYNRIGKRLSEVGNYSYPDIYENARDVIDFQLSKKVFNKLDIRLNFTDLLHQPFLFYQNNDENTNYTKTDNIIQKTTVGSSIGLSLAYKFN